MYVEDDFEAENINCLKDMRCPVCGAYEPFHITCVTVAEIWDEGVEDASDMEWTDKSRCMCITCNHSGIVADFIEKVEEPKEAGK